MSIANYQLSIRYSTAAKAKKGVRWMPRLRKAMKDVASCEKPRGGAGNL